MVKPCAMVEYALFFHTQNAGDLKMSGSNTGQLFGRMDREGNVSIESSDGDMVTSIDADVYPVGSRSSAREEHPDGITLTRADAAKLGVVIEGM
jgi:hypothetical protein